MCILINESSKPEAKQMKKFIWWRTCSHNFPARNEIGKEATSLCTEQQHQLRKKTRQTGKLVQFHHQFRPKKKRKWTPKRTNPFQFFFETWNRVEEAEDMHDTTVVQAVNVGGHAARFLPPPVLRLRRPHERRRGSPLPGGKIWRRRPNGTPWLPAQERLGPTQF